MKALFTVSVTAYSLGIALSAALCLMLLGWTCHRKKLADNTAGIVAVLALPLGLICARAFYCLVKIRFYVYSNIGGAASMLWLWEGGYSLWGALGGAVLAGVIAARVTKQRLSAVLDALTPSLALFVALERGLEYLDPGLGYSYEVQAEAFQRFPFAVFNEFWYGWMFAICAVECLIALAIFAALLPRKRRAGDTARLFFVLYGASQILMESLRKDDTPKWLFVRVYQLTAAIVVALLMIAAVIRWGVKKDQRRMRPGAVIAYCVGFLMLIGVVVAMEFAVDGKILQDLVPWQIYGIMALCCAGIGCAAYQVVFRSTGGKDGEASLPVPAAKGKRK